MMKYKVTAQAKYEYEVEAEDEDGAIEKALEKFHSDTVFGISCWDQILDWTAAPMTEKAVCNKCGAEYIDKESIELVKKWTAGGYAPCPNLSCPGQLEIKEVNNG